MFQLNFTTRVLGEHAAERLRRRETTQTIRSHDSDVVREHRVGVWDRNVGDRIKIVLDGDTIGLATINAIDRLPDGCGFSVDDAERGGFENMKEFFNALYRAGYLFPELNRYDLYRVKFTWI